MCDPLKINCTNDDVQLNNQINTANNNDFSNDVEMENGHNITNGKKNSNNIKLREFVENIRNSFLNFFLMVGDIH